MGNEASAPAPGAAAASSAAEPAPIENDQITKLRLNVVKGENIIKDLSAENRELERQLNIQLAKCRGLEERLDHPTQYRVGLLYLHLKSARSDAEACAAVEELNFLAFGTTGMQEPLAHGYLACYYCVTSKDTDLINDHARAASEYLRAGVAVNNHHCLYIMGAMYYHGVLRKVDIRKAISLYKLAGELGHPLAQYQLGSLYFSGAFGVLKNCQEAFGWWHKAADQGYGKAQYWCGHCLERGLGVEKDIETAGVYYECAGAQGTATESAPGDGVGLELPPVPTEEAETTTEPTSWHMPQTTGLNPPENLRPPAIRTGKFVPGKYSPGSPVSVNNRKVGPSDGAYYTPKKGSPGSHASVGTSTVRPEEMPS